MPCLLIWDHHNRQIYLPYSLPLLLPFYLASQLFPLPLSNVSLNLPFPSPFHPSFNHAVAPDFSISTTAISETEPQLVVRLSAPILTRSFVPAFTGRIEVDITAEDLPAGDTRLRATYGKYHFYYFCC